MTPGTTPLLPTIEPSEADLYAEAMARPLAEKVAAAILLLQTYAPMALAATHDGYWLAYSGGKDSGVILELAKMAKVAYTPRYNVTTLDPPELVRFIRAEHPEVIWQRPRVALLTRLVEKSNGPPTRLARWCCEEYKEQGGNGYASILGIRAAESARRKGLWRQVVPNRSGGTILCPILYWTDDDVWQFHADRSLPYCCLYDEGFTRLGCIGCPLGGPNAQRREFARWPRYEMLWHRAVVRFWDKWHGVPTLKGERRWFEDFGSAEALWNWWITGTSKADADDDAPCQMEFLWQ